MFGWEPVILTFTGSRNGLGRILVFAGHDRRKVYDLLLSRNSELRNFFMTRAINYDLDVRTTTDDWPYLYLKGLSIPKMHLSFTLILLFMFFLSRGTFFAKGQGLNWHFFFLGAAFLFLEFQNINKTALLFGSTWLVNSINISAILILILLANLCVAVLKIRDIKVPYVLLAISLLVIFLVPLSHYNFLGYWQKSILASLVLNLPIFFAGIIFVVSFKNSRHKNLAFGSNLLGSVAGGLMESLAFVIGIRMLVLVTLALYGLSFAFRRDTG